VKPLALLPLLLASTVLGCTHPDAAVAPQPSPPGGAPAAPVAAPSPTRTSAGMVREGTPAEVNIAAARERGGTRGFTWRAWSTEAFAEARRDHKLILLDGAAEWCHWCHVMDETTYRDPEVGRILSERFVAIRVDVDEHPDLAERYGAWGWPATIIFSPEAAEIGKYRGYLPAEDLRRALAETEAAVKRAAVIDPAAHPIFHGPAEAAATPAALGWVASLALYNLGAYYDEKEGGWGHKQKAPLGANVEVELARAAHGDPAALARAVFTLKQQRPLLDPVWGGVYQYSAGSTWTEPHYEKLMPFQAANLEAYARTAARSGDATLLADAQGIARYMGTFLSNTEGAFLVSQDADAGAHDDHATFVDGDVYYRFGDKERRALGLPRVDDHVYGYENGLAITAFVAFYEASHDPAVLARAKLAARVVQHALVGPDGAVRRNVGRESGARYLADAASLGLALARLAEVFGPGGKGDGAPYRDAAVAIAGAMVRDLADEATGAFWDRTTDPAAAGVFARREKPFSHNVMAARFFAALARVTGDAAWKERGRRTLAAACTPRAVDERGRMLGDLVLTLDDLGAIAWP
jgi:uncharacterized protein YyaL (SSP411 family)